MLSLRRLFSVLMALGVICGLSVVQAQPSSCDRRVYLTFDTGHMGVADLVAQVLQRQQVRATFFAADESTQTGDGSLGTHWSAWWRARATEGHVLASHTLDHLYWRDRKSTRLNSSHSQQSRMPSSA